MHSILRATPPLVVSRLRDRVRLRTRLRELWERLQVRLRPASGPGRTKRIVVLAEERIGADRLVALLNDHPQVRIHPHGLAHVDGGADEQLRWLREGLSGPYPFGISVSGVCTAVSDALDTDAVASLLQELRPLVVHVTNENFVRAALFRLNARRSRRWAQAWLRVETRGEDGDISPPAQDGEAEPLDPRRFTTLLRSVEIRQVGLRRFVEALGLPVHRMSESRVLTDERSVVAEVLRDVGLVPTDIERPPLCRRDERYLEALEDVGALEEHLRDTPYESMAQELYGAR